MGNLTITKVWHDNTEAFCEIEILAASDSVSVKGTYYVADETLLELSRKLKDFLNLQNRSFTWKAGECGPDSTPNFEISAEYTDMVKHMRFNISMEIEDTKLDKYYLCSFFIDGLENGPLYEFSKKLVSFDMNQTISVL